MTPNQTQGIGQQSTLHMSTVVPRVLNFRQFRSTISHFQDIVHFRIFPLTPMLKFQTATKFLILADCQNIYNFIFSYGSLMAALLIIKFG